MDETAKKSEIAAEIERRMTLLRMSQRSLSLQSGLSESVVRKIITGTTASPRHDTLEKIAQVLGCAVSDLTGETKSRKMAALDGRPDVRDGSFELYGQSFVAVPVYDLTVSAGPGGLIDSDHSPPVSYEWFPIERIRTISQAKPEQLALVTVAGDSMEPAFHHGDMVLVDLTVQHANADGIYVLALGETVLIKRISVDPVKGLLTIGSDNPAYRSYEDIAPDDVHISGRVIWAARSIG